MHKPVVGFGQALVNHEVDMWSTTGVIAREDCGKFHDTISISVPTPTKPSFRTRLESTGRIVRAESAGRIR